MDEGSFADACIGKKKIVYLFVVVNQGLLVAVVLIWGRMGIKAEGKRGKEMRDSKVRIPCAPRTTILASREELMVGSGKRSRVGLACP